MCEPEPRGVAAERLLDRLKHPLVPVDEIHLVDRQDDVGDAEQAGNGGVAEGLREDALLRVDQDQGEVRGRGAGRHVAGVLDVSWRVGDDEAAPGGLEAAVGDIDGDALFAFRLETVDEERRVDPVSTRSPDTACRGDVGEFILEDERGVVEQTCDECRLAVIDTAARHEAQ